MQAHKDTTTKNSNKAQTLDYLHFRSVGNNKEGYELLYLQTNKVINRAYITPTPVNKSIIR